MPEHAMANGAADWTMVAVVVLLTPSLASPENRARMSDAVASIETSAEFGGLVIQTVEPTATPSGSVGWPQLDETLARLVRSTSAARFAAVVFAPAAAVPALRASDQAMPIEWRALPGALEWELPPDATDAMLHVRDLVLQALEIAADGGGFDRAELWAPAVADPPAPLRTVVAAPPSPDSETLATSSVPSRVLRRPFVRSEDRHVQRARRRVGIAAIEELRQPTRARPLLYIVQTASPDLTRDVLRTQKAALVLLADAVGSAWTTIIAKAAEDVTRVAGPGALSAVVRQARGGERSSRFDLGATSTALARMISLDVAALGRRGYEVPAPVVLMLATEPPIVDSYGQEAYVELVNSSGAVVWMMIGDQDWWSVPPELDSAGSIVYQVRHDGVERFIQEILSEVD